MKKIIQLAILLYLVFAIIGCVPPTPKEDDEIVEKSIDNCEVKSCDEVYVPNPTEQ